jgi:hypothetical protein
MQPMFCFQFFWCSQDGNFPQVAIFGYWQNMKQKKVKHPYTFLATYLNHRHDFELFFSDFDNFSKKNHWICNKTFQKSRNNVEFHMINKYQPNMI